MNDSTDFEGAGVSIVGGPFPGTNESRDKLLRALAEKLAGEETNDPYRFGRMVRIRWSIDRVIGPADGWVWFVLVR